MLDGNRVTIKVGDILKSKYDFLVLVCEGKNNELYGSLICPIGHSCRDIPYSLEASEDYQVVYAETI